jgi:hypothetical protein
MDKTRKPYSRPEIVHELELETRAGSSPVDQVIGSFEDFEE